MRVAESTGLPFIPKEQNHACVGEGKVKALLMWPPCRSDGKTRFIPGKAKQAETGLGKLGQQAGPVFVGASEKKNKPDLKRSQMDRLQFQAGGARLRS
jgi:hypothetical protein